MQSLAQKHFLRTKALVSKVDKSIIANWLLKEGYYPEQYVLPPCFHVEYFVYKDEPYYSEKKLKTTKKCFQLESVFFPKSQLTDRVFSIIEPHIYHDLAWYLMQGWELVQEHLFHEEIRFYSYSFPIPVTAQNEGRLGRLRSGRMIYEFIEMAENDLVAEAFKYSYKIRTDIKNFYPSIYTHSIAWALHGKEKARERENRTTFRLLGGKIDRLFQLANDRCTNGLAIGPVISDLTSEIILAAIDRKASIALKDVKFLGVRFKDDYQILCHSRSDAQKIIKSLQKQMRDYNLSLNESKTAVLELPEGLFRPWILEYQPFSLKKVDEITYKKFETTLLNLLRIDERHPGTGIIDKFLAELTTKDYKLKLRLTKKQVLKAVSLLFLLKNRRSKAFPQILSIIELIILEFQTDVDLVDKIFRDVQSLAKDSEDHLYDVLWIYYFLKSHEREKGLEKFDLFEQSKLLKSMKENSQQIFTNSSPEDIKLFRAIKPRGKNELLAKYLAIYPKKGIEDA